MKTRAGRLPPIVFLVLGAIIVAFGAFWTWRNAMFVVRAERVQGEVVALAQHRGTGKSKQPVFAPVFEFKDLKGRVHRVEEPVRTGPSSHPVGSQVQVLYWPDEPQEARINSFSTLWFGPCGFFLVGAVFFGIAAISRKSRGKPAP